MSKALTSDLILARAKTDHLHSVKKINLWGNDIEDVSLLRQMPNVEVLSLSVNKISSLKEFSHCPKLQELYLRKNNITDLSEISYLTDLSDLKILWLWDNPCAETPQYREYIIKLLPNLTKLDNEAITMEERTAAAKLNINLGNKKIAASNNNNYLGDYQSNSEKEAPYSSKQQGNDHEDNKYSGDYQTPKNYGYRNEGNEYQKPREEGSRRGIASEKSAREAYVKLVDDE